MRGNGFGIHALKYFRYYAVGYAVEIRARPLRFVGEHKWLLAECKMRKRYFVTHDRHFTEQSRIPVFRDATWRSWMSGHRRIERTHCLRFQILDKPYRIKAMCSEITHPTMQHLFSENRIPKPTSAHGSHSLGG
jgi:hypothetical protein